MSARLLLLLLLSLARRSAASQVDPLLFDKRDGLDTRFPPDIVPQRARDIPQGHLRCFGHQSHTMGLIRSLPDSPSPSDFARAVGEGQPLLLRLPGLLSAPIANLSDEQLSRQFGDEQIHFVPIRKHRTEAVVHPDTLASFLSSYRKRDEYLASTLPHPLRPLFPLPGVLGCGPLARRLLEAELWMAFGGAGSLMHYHGDHQLHCLFDGRKDFVFVEAKYRKDFRCRETRPHSGEGVSDVDMDMINMFKDPQLAQVPWRHATARAGDCVFIPAGFLHHTRSYGRALALKVHFAPAGAEGDADAWRDCKGKAGSEPRLLDDAGFVWTMKNGVEQLADEELTAESLREVLGLVARGQEVLTRDEFVAFYDRATAKAERKMPAGGQVFDRLDRDGDGELVLDDLPQDAESLGKVAATLNRAHLPSHKEL